ncbi:hypothetical protein C9939_00980 [Pseudidiomarina aestuarii]|nr:hypothetical protein C9939_00980 [Pseudidiomarina aestuarii]
MVYKEKHPTRLSPSEVFWFRALIYLAQERFITEVVVGAWSRDPEAVIPLCQIIDGLTIHATWDEIEERWDRKCEVTFDFAAIIAADKRHS